MLYALPPKDVVSNVTVGKQGKEEIQSKSCPQTESTTEQFFLSFIFVRGIDKIVGTSLENRLSKAYR